MPYSTGRMLAQKIAYSARNSEFIQASTGGNCKVCKEATVLFKKFPFY